MKFIICLLSMVIISALLKAQDKSKQPLEVVPSVDLARYCGVWCEIARLPNSFQTKCASDVVATYTLLDDGQIKVVNRCRKENGEISEAEGKAKRASDDEPNSKLKVRFAPAILSFLPFVWGNYWILEIDTSYTYAVIGEPDREYLWILSRTPKMDENILQGILGRMKEKGFDVEKIMWTKQTQ
ncbi:MAG: lipocalin family protein [Ignavibacteriales bacterium]|nr:lipocalin family protein [Ignavibacteriales bacterium]